MAVTLAAGEIVNQCDATTGFNTGNADTDIYIDPTASIGTKVSATTTEFYTTTLGATAPYDFSSGGGEFGQHIIMWFNGLTPVNATTGFQIIVGNGTSRGRWNVPPGSAYTGGFASRVINPAADFNVIAAGSWTTNGNPAQLSNITQMGGALTTTTSIMGNFNNALIDQITVGTGLRVDAGTVGSPNSFETLRVQDEDTTRWGWVTSSAGAIIVKGGIFIGPATGTATSVFTATASIVTFAASNVAVGFYVISIRGSNTDVNLTQCIIRAENPSTARWSLTLDGTSIPDFDDNSSLFQGFATMTLRSGSSLTGTTLDNGTSIVQNSAVLSGCKILNANTTDGTGFITSNDLSSISNCSFTFSDGHAITYNGTATATYTFTGNTFTGYGANGTNDAAIYNSNTSGTLTINVSGGVASPTVRTASGGTTIVNNTVDLTVTVVDSANNPIPTAQVAIFQSSDDSQIMNEDTATISAGSFVIGVRYTIVTVGTTDFTAIGAASNTVGVSFTATGAGSGTGTASNGIATESFNLITDTPIYVRVRKSSSGETKYIPTSTTGTITGSGFSARITLRVDSNA